MERNMGYCASLTHKYLFLHFGDLLPNHGISNKIQAQCTALESEGLDIALTHVHRNDKKDWEFYIDDDIIGRKKKSNVNLFNVFYCYPHFFSYIRKNRIKGIYWRWGCMTPGQFILLALLRILGCRVIMEIPTFPYDNEWKYEQHDWIANFPRRCDSILRHLWRFFIYRIVTFSEDRYIYGVPCINISNGYNPKRIRHKEITSIGSHLHMVAVARVQWWHGFDRIINGLREYYQGSKPPFRVTLSIVGDGETASLMKLVNEYDLCQYVNFTGALSGVALDQEFDKAHVAIGSLGRHRSGIFAMKSLKNVEYASRGIPFVYSETNTDFDNASFIMKVPADETPLCISDVIEFVKQNKMTPEQIAESANPYSWEKQMQKVILEMNKEYINK